MRLSFRRITQTMITVGIFLFTLFYFFTHSDTGSGDTGSTQRKHPIRSVFPSGSEIKQIKSLIDREKKTLFGYNVSKSTVVSHFKKNTIVKRALNFNTTKKLPKSVALKHTKHKNNLGVLLDDIRTTQLSDIFITVKTTKTFHETRIKLLLETWWIYARDQTYFFTDADDTELNEKTKEHVVNTKCTPTHDRNSLCCKMSVEFDYFILSKKRWFCHVDDDTYINIPVLLAHLQRYNHTKNWYLGKPSLNHPIEIQNTEDRNGPKFTFWFATGGAGFCISRPLAMKMIPYAGGGRLKQQCSKIRLPDDCAIGFIIEHYLKEKLTVIPEFHSHLEGLWMIKQSQLQKQITLSYAFNVRNKKWNVLQLPGESIDKDPTRLLSIHCFLNPHLEQCSKKKNR